MTVPMIMIPHGDQALALRALDLDWASSFDVCARIDEILCAGRSEPRHIDYPALVTALALLHGGGFVERRWRVDGPGLHAEWRRTLNRGRVSP